MTFFELYVKLSTQQVVVNVNYKMNGDEKMRANKDIRDAVEENGFRLWELAEALGLSSDATLSRKLRRELPDDQKQHIFKTIDRMVEQRQKQEGKW